MSAGLVATDFMICRAVQVRPDRFKLVDRSFVSVTRTR